MISAICGKVELVYEGEVEGPVIVAQNLIGKAIRTQFLNFYPDPEKSKRVMECMLKMKKIVIKDLEEAYKG